MVRQLFLVLLFPCLGFASTTTPTTTETRAGSNILTNKQFEDNREITDTKLKAEAGSLSRYSLKLNLSYYGPVLSDLSAADQPNPEGSVGVYATSLGGSLSMRIRQSASQAWSLGTGLKVIHPFHGMDRTDINNPYLSYDVSHRSGNLQYRTSPGLSVITVPNFTKIGEYGALNWDNSVVWNIGDSSFAMSLDSGIGYYLYNRGYQKSDGKASLYTVSLVPGLKYNLNDRWSFNTSWGLLWWNPRSRDDQSVMLPRMVNQRIGAGYGISRGVYFAPFIQFYPERIASDTTTVNMSTIFSLF